MAQKSKKSLNPHFLIILVVGLVVLLTYVTLLRGTSLTSLRQSDPSVAASNTETEYNLDVYVIKYFPLTADGQSIDISVTGDVGDSYSTIRERTNSVTTNLLSLLPKATAYLGYKNPSSTPAINYTLVGTQEYTQAVPMLTDGSRRPNYNQIMQQHNICDLVDNQNVREVWIWAYQGPTFPGTNAAYLSISESKMAGPFGDISNSPRLNDMPVCNNTYRVYTYNYGRGTSEAMEAWGHQIESEVSAVDSYVFRTLWQGPAYPQTLQQTGRCGSVHNPPNARSEYDRINTISQPSDCLDWNPDSMGVLSDINCNNWGCADISDSNNAGLNYMIWNWQNMPGKNNTKKYQGKQFRNWWDIHGDFDRVMGGDRTLFITAQTNNEVTITDTFTRTNATTLGVTDTQDAWQAVAGNWGVINNQAYSASPCPAPGYAVLDSGDSNGYIEVTLPVNRQDLRIPFRYSDANNLLWLENHGSFYAINQLLNGERSALGQTVSSIVPSDGDIVRIEFKDAQILVYINNVIRISATQQSNIRGTKHGIGNWCNGEIRFDNLKIAVQKEVLPTITPAPTVNVTMAPSPTPIATPMESALPATTPSPIATPKPSAIILLPGVLKGKITSRSGQPIAGAEVSAELGSVVQTTYSDSVGNYYLNNLSPTTYTVKYTASGYVGETRKQKISAKTDTVTNVSLRPTK